MKRSIPIAALAAISLVALISCAKKADQAAQTASDSLLSTNPVEQPQGNITPQTNYQSPPQNQTPPTQTQAPAPARPKPSGSTSKPANPGVTIPEGTGMSISVDAELTSETAHEGDTWSGTVKDPVVVGSAAPIPAGSTVTGVIAGVHPAEKGTRAVLVLAISSVNVNGKSVTLHATADSIVAGSTRARNLGAIGGGAAAGALLGKALGGSGKSAVIGGILGGAAATGAVAASKGYQATVKAGQVLTFHVDKNTTIRS
ncbi:MAG TPA: hypothetical protein VL332_12225 [Candidatus Saccharimonadaceae bacterium]|jgi:hypothetical protein|nr:hypothetical protein [Candidatus Saccharimonadaceae bacterium]